MFIHFYKTTTFTCMHLTSKKTAFIFQFTCSLGITPMTLPLLGLPLMTYNCLKITIEKNYYTQEVTHILIIAQLQKLP